MEATFPFWIYSLVGAVFSISFPKPCLDPSRVEWSVGLFSPQPVHTFWVDFWWFMIKTVLWTSFRADSLHTQNPLLLG